VRLSDFMDRVATIYLAGDVAAEMADATREVERIAYHEAGHACVAMIFGRVPQAVELRKSERGWGGCCHIKPDDRPDDFFPSDGEFVDLLDRVRGVEGEPPLDREAMRSQARAILEEHWSFVQAIAGNLLTKTINSPLAICTEGGLRKLWKFHKGEMDYVFQEK